MNMDMPFVKSFFAAIKCRLIKPVGFDWILKGLIGLIAALLIFQLGMFVGFRKASYSFGWGDNYHRVFGGPESGLMRDFVGRDFLNGHGLAGSIVSVDDPDIIIIGNDGIEKTVATTEHTAIVRGRQPIDLSDLFPDDTVTIIGRPEGNGIIFADIIRVLDFNHNAPLLPRPFP
jgi:hypothetical protein